MIPPMHDRDAAWQRPHPKLIRLWRLQVLLGALVIAAAVAVPAGLAAVREGGLDVPAAAARTALVALGTALLVGLPLLWRVQSAVQAYRWQRRPGEGVVVVRGAWWQRETWVPISRLQHLDIQRGPLERWMGLATLELYTAGSHDHKTRLPGLEPAQAQAVRDELLAELQRNAPPAAGVSPTVPTEPAPDAGAA
jgi:hypothetical protein